MLENNHSVRFHSAVLCMNRIPQPDFSARTFSFFKHFKHGLFPFDSQGLEQKISIPELVRAKAVSKGGRLVVVEQFFSCHG